MSPDICEGDKEASVVVSDKGYGLASPDSVTRTICFLSEKNPSNRVVSFPLIIPDTLWLSPLSLSPPPFLSVKMSALWTHISNEGPALPSLVLLRILNLGLTQESVSLQSWVTGEGEVCEEVSIETSRHSVPMPGSWREGPKSLKLRTKHKTVKQVWHGALGLERPFLG